MESEESYIPYEERTPKALCRDISIKAEKLYLKKDKNAVLFMVVALLAIVALSWYFKRFVDWWWLSTGIGLISVVYSVFFKIHQKLINDMNLAANPKQFLSMAQKLRKSVRLRSFICIVLGLWPSFLNLVHVWWWYAVSLVIAYVFALLAVGIKPERLIDADLSDDLDDLEYLLNK